MGKCPKCSKFRKIDAHLFELASFCTVLDNVADFKDEEEDALVSTVTIGEWLKLAAQLDNCSYRYLEIHRWCRVFL